MKNNTLNQKIADTLKECGNIILPDRQCNTVGDCTEVFLHEDCCMIVNRFPKTITLNGNTPATRKSVRLINTVLSLFVNDRVVTRNGNWYLVDKQNVWNLFSGKQLTLKFS